MDVIGAVFLLNEVVGKSSGRTASANRTAMFSDACLDWSGGHSDIEFIKRAIHQVDTHWYVAIGVYFLDPDFPIR